MFAQEEVLSRLLTAVGPFIHDLENTWIEALLKAIASELETLATSLATKEVPVIATKVEKEVPAVENKVVAEINKVATELEDKVKSEETTK